jgi:hypothetical protein
LIITQEEEATVKLYKFISAARSIPPDPLLPAYHSIASDQSTLSAPLYFGTPSAGFNLVNHFTLMQGFSTAVIPMTADVPSQPRAFHFQH